MVPTPLLCSAASAAATCDRMHPAFDNSPGEHDCGPKPQAVSCTRSKSMSEYSAAACGTCTLDHALCTVHCARSSEHQTAYNSHTWTTSTDRLAARRQHGHLQSSVAMRMQGPHPQCIAAAANIPHTADAVSSVRRWRHPGLCAHRGLHDRHQHQRVHQWCATTITKTRRCRMQHTLHAPDWPECIVKSVAALSGTSALVISLDHGVRATMRPNALRIDCKPDA